MTSGQTILVVEDDAGIRALYHAVLAARGHAVIEVERGDEALLEARACRPDAVVLDLGLPGLDGLGVLAQLKGDVSLRNVPVIVSTAWDDGSTVTAALEQGAHDYVRKPFEPGELTARIEGALRLKAERDELSADVAMDLLTKLPDRRSLTAELEREHALAKRGRPPFSVLLLDIDHFKRVNDTHGHGVGDDVLRVVSRRLFGRARASDLVGRWGGEEFLVVAPDTNLDGAMRLAEDLRRAISESPIPTDAAPVDVTASVGAAAWEGETIEELMARADDALYRAKSAGRDVVIAAAPLEPVGLSVA